MTCSIFMSSKVCHLNVTKIIKKEYKKKKKTHERYQSISKEETEKKAPLRSWTIHESTRRWKTKACWIYKELLKNY